MRFLEEKKDMDRIDCAILDCLQNDGRMSNKELAAAVGLAPSSCLERVRKLQEKKIIQGYQARVDVRALGIGLQAFVSVRLATHSRKYVDDFREHIQQCPEVVAVYHVAGQDDFLVPVAVRDAAHLRNLTLDAFTTRAEVARLNTALIYEYLRSPTLPNYNEES